MKFAKVKNTLGAKNTYKGVNTFIFAKDEEYNYIFELQFHTKETFDAKMITHDYYEVERNPKYNDEEREKSKIQTTRNI